MNEVMVMVVFCCTVSLFHKKCDGKMSAMQGCQRMSKD